MKQPWSLPGIGWVLAVIVMVLALLVGFAGVAIPAWIMFLLLALAILL